MADENKARILADGIEVWCAYDKLVKVEELIPHPKNPNTHPQNQIKILAQNIRYHGWRHPIVVSKLSGYIVAGHGRLEAARELGVSIVPVEYQDFATENNELAVLVGDNRLAELSTLDLNGLQDIIDGFKETNFDAILAGFEPADLDALLGEKTPAIGRKNSGFRGRRRKGAFGVSSHDTSCKLPLQNVAGRLRHLDRQAQAGSRLRQGSGNR